MGRGRFGFKREADGTVDHFVSTYVNKIDRKGRVSIPAEFRAVLTRRNSAMLLLYPALYAQALEGAGEELLSDIMRKADSLAPMSAERDDFLDAVMPNIERLSFDSEGRVMLPESLIAYANLSERAAFVGRGPNFQVWNPDVWAERANDARTRLRDQRLAARKPEGGA